MSRKQNSSAAHHTAAKELTEHLRLSPDSAHITLFNQRMLLMHGFSLSELRKEIIERLGMTTARSVFTRLGYQQGIEDYNRVRALYGDDPYLNVTLGPALRGLEGYVVSDAMEIHIDQEKGEFYGDFTWLNSWEARSHIDQFESSGVPACWMSVGYASAYATGIFGKPVLARETECIAMGHARCRAIMKPLDEWEDTLADLAFFQIEDFVDPPITNRSGTRRSKTHIPFAPPVEDKELVGASAAFNSVIYLLKRVAQTETTVLFLGESGVGKERFSRALHAIGPRSEQPFISINCAAIPDNLIESELFGVEKGAFTGATASRPGRFERANGGTLFLDEIGSLPFHAQGKLLRVLQEREIERIGGTETKHIDVRVVAATNEDLRQAVKEGRFRADLYYRLNVFPVRIPPLRDRRDDIPLLLNVFVARFTERSNKSIRGITQQALDALWHYDWPGNVRELENFIERAVILANDDEAIDIHHLFTAEELPNLRIQSLKEDKSNSEQPIKGSDKSRELVNKLLDQGQTFADIEQALIDAALIRNHGKVTAAAKQLGIGRGKMQYRMTKIKQSDS
ncbi:sigma 54-interacting transcriptional regulator [Amphritea sp.]|uniref:sigma 54-interacting transcriptional regulator n=1 Tax=Amphritea sp. TaxID=1872502 RepID=UPI003D09AACE